MKKVLMVLAAVLVLAGGITACGGARQVMQPPASGQQQPQEQGQQQTPPSGQQEPEAQEPPATTEPPSGGSESWGDVPIYPGADLAYKLEGEEPGEVVIVMEHRIYTTGDNAEQVAGWYRSALSDNGWEEVDWVEMAVGFIGSCQKGADMALSVGIATNDAEGHTMITLDKRYPK